MFNQELIDRYNKTTVEYKKIFNQSFDVKTFCDDLDKLGFALDPNDKNFRYSKKFYDTKGYGNKGWHTSDSDGYLTIYKYSPKYGSYSVKEKADFTEKDITQHVTANKIKKRKKSTKKFWKEALFKDRDDTKISFYNMNHTFGACYKANNNVIWFDVDDHDNSGVADFKLIQLLDLLGVKDTDALMIEKSFFNGGYHIAFKVNFNITDNNFYKDLARELKNHIEGIDVNFSQTVLRLPLSYEYIPVHLDNYDKKYESFEEFHKSLNFDKTIDSKFLNLIYETYSLCENVNEFCNVLNDLNKKSISKLTMADVVANFKRQKKNLDFWDNPVEIIKPKEIQMSRTLINCEITAGNRYEMYKKLVPHCVNDLEYSLDETIDYIFNHNVSSKDIKLYGKDGIRRSISGYYQKCLSNKQKGLYGATTNISYQLNKFVDNEKYIPADLLEILNNPHFQKHITKKFKKLYSLNRAKYDKSYIYSDIKSSNIAIQFPYILKQVIGSYYYQMKEIDDKFSRCINKKYLPYIGFQLSDVHLSRIVNESKELNGVVGSNKYRSFQIQYLKKSLYQLLGLKSFNLITGVSNLNRNYHKGFCTSFIANLNNIFNFFIKEAKSLFGSRFFNNIFNKIQSYIIYYIALEDKPLKKQDLYKKVVILSEKLGADPPPKIEFG